ncbi:peptidoglycan/LPS O-acetylase OafA/YrhL [Bradyrhizobium sp. GM24.11]
MAYIYFLCSAGFLSSVSSIEPVARLRAARTPSGGEIVRFYENRAFRIWPIYYLTVALIAAYGFVGGRPQLRGDEIFSLLTMTSNIFQSYVWPNYPSHFGAFWSVAIEEQFYLWAAVAFLLIPQTHAWKICVFVIALAIGFGVASFVLGLPGRSIYTGSLTNFGLMALGGLAVMKWKGLGWLAAPCSATLHALPNY